MNKKQFIMLVALLTTVITLASCWNICGCSQTPEPLTLRELLANRTYIVQKVTRANGDNATQEFNNFKMSFNSDGTTCILVMSNITTQTSCNVSENTITLLTPPQGWANTLKIVRLSEDSFYFDFEAVITDTNLGVRTHTFEMWKQ